MTAPGPHPDPPRPAPRPWPGHPGVPWPPRAPMRRPDDGPGARAEWELHQWRVGQVCDHGPDCEVWVALHLTGLDVAELRAAGWQLPTRHTEPPPPPVPTPSTGLWWPLVAFGAVVNVFVLDLAMLADGWAGAVLVLSGLGWVTIAVARLLHLGHR